MAPIVAPGIARFTVEGTLAGEACVNIIDVDLSTATGQTRTEICFETAGDILNNWTDHVLPLLVEAYVANVVRWVDLNSSDGVTGVRSETDVNTWPLAGTETATPSPNNTYYKVFKNLEGGNRQSRRGVMRLGGVTEAATGDGIQGNLLRGAWITDINTAMEDFKDGINGQGTGGQTRNIVVVHTVDGEFTDSSIVSTYQCAPVVGTIRRRMPGYGI